MIDETILGKGRHIGVKFYSEDGSLELWLNHTMPMMTLTAEELYDLFAWLYEKHRAALAPKPQSDERKREPG